MEPFPVPLDAFAGGQGYVATHWGIRVAWDVIADGEPPWPFATARTIDSIVWVIAEDGTRGAHPGPSAPATFQLWLVQVYRPGYPLAAERRWHPDWGVRDSIVGLTEPHTRDDLLPAWHGRALIVGYLEEEARKSRPRWLDLDQAARAVQQLLNSNPPIRPTRQAIADAIAAEEETEIPLDTLKSRWRRHKDYGDAPITLSEVLQLARQELHP